MSYSFFEGLSDELRVFLAPLISAAEDPYWLSVLLSQLGSPAESAATQAVAAALQPIPGAVAAIESIASTSSPSFADIARLLEAAKQAIRAIRSLDDPQNAAAGLAGIGKDLVNLLTGIYIGGRAPTLYHVLILLALVDSAEEIVPTLPVVSGGKTLRGPVLLPRFHPERLSRLLQDPVAFLRSQYLINPLATDADAAAVADKIFPRVRGLLRLLCVLCKYGTRAEERPFFGNAAPIADHMLKVWISEEILGATEDAGLAFAISPVSRGDLGLVIVPFGTVKYQGEAGQWQIEVDVSAQVEALALGRRGVVMAASTQTASLEAKVSATLPRPESGPAFVVGSPTGTRLEVGGASFVTDLQVGGGKFDLLVSGDVSSAAVVIRGGDGDGLLNSILPAGGLSIGFDLGVVWSTAGGLSFRGAAGLDATLPVGIDVAGIKVPSVYLRLHATDANVEAEISASVGLSIGPFQAVIDRVGLIADLTFPSGGGNLGGSDLSFGFKLPSGVGLSIDAAGVSGGGFLRNDDVKHEYSGVLQLQFADFALQAFGLITTQVAGRSGYSLLALIDAEFPPIQLGWGFTLDGVGGLVAVHRAPSLDALRAAIKAGTLSKILFPTSAITNAPQTLSTLDALFPVAPGRFLFGPMARIGWGTPTVLTASVALLLELPSPVRIILLARVALALPNPAEPLVRINMDSVGVLDLGKSEFSLDASLYDSRLLSFALSGDMALRVRWSGTREFLLAIGGFHPRFAAPPGFPSLKRITIDMPSGVVSTMRLQAYLAVTSNTLQFGAKLDVFIGVSGFGLSGHLGFDALLQLDPFHFETDISASVALTAGGDNLMSVGLDASLSGPAPWHISGSFKFSILFWDVHVSFSQTWGAEAPATQIPAVDVTQMLLAAVRDPRSWGVQLPAGTPALVAPRRIDTPGLVAHPLAQLELRERIVPLGLDITRFGAAVPSGTRRFAIGDAKVGNDALPSERVEDDFAPAQFFDLDDEQKLARPSFERHDAGLRFGFGVNAGERRPVKSGKAVEKEITYETSFIDQPNGEIRKPQAPVGNVGLGILVAGGAAERAAIRYAGRRKYSAGTGGVVVKEPRFVVASADSLTRADVGPAAGDSYSDVWAALHAELAKSPERRAKLEIVALHEVGA